MQDNDLKNEKQLNNNNDFDHKKLIQKVNTDSDIIEQKLQAYQHISNSEFLQAKNAYYDYLKLTEQSNTTDLYTKCDALYSYSLGCYLCGEFEMCFEKLKSAYDLISTLPRLNKNKLLELKIIANICLICLSLSNFKESNEYCNILAELVKRESDKKLQKEMLRETMQIFFHTDSLNEFYSMNVNLHNLNEKILINNDLNSGSKNIEYKNKIMSKVIFFFHKFLKEDDIDSWIQCLNEESENFKLINESSGFLIAIFNMFLSMYAKNPNITEKAKGKILSVSKCIVNTKSEGDLKPLELLLQECKEKMRQAALLYKKLQNIEIDVEASNTTTSFFKNMKRSKDGSFNNSSFNGKSKSQSVLAKIFLTHAKNYLTVLKEENGYAIAPLRYEQMINQIDLSLDLVKNGKIDVSDLNVLDFDIDLALAMKSLFENLLYIRYKFIVEKYFRKLMRITFGYENLEMKIMKRQKKFEAFVTRKFLDICEGKNKIILSFFSVCYL